MCGSRLEAVGRASAPVSTASTPGIARAAAVSIELMRAWACGERSTNARAWPGRSKSSL